MSWLASNAGYVALVVYLVAQIVVAITPKKYQATKWYGGALWLAHRLSWLKHYDEIGTLQVPILMKDIVLGDEPK